MMSGLKKILTTICKNIPDGSLDIYLFPLYLLRQTI